MNTSEILTTEIDFGSPDYDESIILRDLVLRKPLNLQYLPEDLAMEFDSFHLAIKKEERIIACLVMKPIDQTRIKMRQVAVHPDLQGQQVGRLLVSYSEFFCKTKGFQTIELHARKHVVPFYEKLGYTALGDEFLEVNIPHLKMEKQLV